MTFPIWTPPAPEAGPPAPARAARPAAAHRPWAIGSSLVLAAGLFALLRDLWLGGVADSGDRVVAAVVVLLALLLNLYLLGHPDSPPGG